MQALLDIQAARQAIGHTGVESERQSLGLEDMNLREIFKAIRLNEIN